MAIINRKTWNTAHVCLHWQESRGRLGVATYVQLSSRPTSLFSMKLRFWSVSVARKGSGVMRTGCISKRLCGSSTDRRIIYWSYANFMAGPYGKKRSQKGSHPCAFLHADERLVRSARPRRMENAPGIRESGAVGPRVFANIMRTGGGIPE